MGGNSARAPLDGGWAWVILLATSVMMFCVNGTDRAQSITYRVVLTHLAGRPTLTAMASGLQLSLRYLLAFLGTYGEGRFGAKLTVIGGSLLQTTGVLLSLLVTEDWHFLLAFGIIGGMGAAMSYSACVVTLRAYFEKSRLLAFAITSVSMCVGHAVHPLLLGRATHLAGYQGFIFCWASITLQVCISGALCRPLEANYYGRQEETQVKPEVQELKSSHSPNVIQTEMSRLIEELPDDSPKSRESRPRTYYFLLAAVFFTTVAYYPPMVFIVDILIRRGDTLERAATLTGLANMLDVGLKVVVAATLHRPALLPYTGRVFFLSMLLSALSCAGLATFSARWTTYLFYSTACVGVSFINTLYLVILGDVVSRDYFPTAVSTLGMLQGLAHLVGPLFNGFLRDWSGEYTISLASSSIGFFTGFLLLCIDHITNYITRLSR